MFNQFVNLWTCFLDRFFEDHENLVENILMWDRDGNSKNKLLYVERKDKYHFVSRPELYLVGFACKDTEYDELTRRQLLKVSRNCSVIYAHYDAVLIDFVRSRITFPVNELRRRN